MLDRVLVGKERGQVDDHVRPVREYLRQHIVLTNIALHEFHARVFGHVPALRRRQIVEYHNQLGPAKQGASEIAADTAGSPRNENDFLIQVQRRLLSLLRNAIAAAPNESSEPKNER